MTNGDTINRGLANGFLRCLFGGGVRLAGESGEAARRRGQPAIFPDLAKNLCILHEPCQNQ